MTRAIYQNDNCRKLGCNNQPTTTTTGNSCPICVVFVHLYVAGRPQSTIRRPWECEEKNMVMEIHNLSFTEGLLI